MQDISRLHRLMSALTALASSNPRFSTRCQVAVVCIEPLQDRVFPLDLQADFSFVSEWLAVHVGRKKAYSARRGSTISQALADLIRAVIRHELERARKLGDSENALEADFVRPWRRKGYFRNRLGSVPGRHAAMACSGTRRLPLDVPIHDR